MEKDNIFCLMGPNGAGKTTLVRILSTQLKPTSGKAYVLGFDVIKEANEIRKRIAILPQEARPPKRSHAMGNGLLVLGFKGRKLFRGKEEDGDCFKRT
ncbi:ATP-binding cassette domain-containing protein [Thermococcus sp. 101 C5]|uniref:ATP-binding cassette domain-containing protein n=1 Tax=Thermococcus sp. 101 C5 TaxID=2654197 RepID=UPI00128B23EF|nr:ATP-binding cassette domain-containing protein [Thermococcus sp. 101 C5]MPW39229.1 ATP-binding cassette domain-containing protein [Thermococcus sp. 101 C5]